MNVLYEESGSFKAGAVLVDNDTSLHVEAPHGKRSKVKGASVLLRFEQPKAAELVREAESYADAIDAEFLWECSGEAEFGFEALAREYCGRVPTPIEAAGILFKLHSAPMYFYRKGKGRYRAAPAETLKAALASMEKKRRLQETIDQWAHQLQAGVLPEALRAVLPELLYKPDRNKPETKALEKACDVLGLGAAKTLQRAGALPSSHDYHLNSFLFECFPRGTEFPPCPPPDEPDGLPVAEAQAFSLDDLATTEIDDAFSVSALDSGRLRIGIHIAAPALGFAPGSVLERIARERLSTVYMPGNKITMLPPEAIERFTLGAGRLCPAVSLYVDVRESDWEIEREHSAVELVRIAANLRHQELEMLDGDFRSGTVPDAPFSTELYRLWQFALALERLRGKPSSAQDRAEYSFTVTNDPERGERIIILPRPRGTPLDKLVAELMILVNSTWGRMLDENGYAAVYRVQSNGKVRMTTSAAPHQGLGISHYAWATSPLRRYVDLVNQWQLLCLLRGEAPAFERNDVLLAAVHDFEITYATYAEFQWRMERYWSLRWLLQEGIRVAAAVLVRDNLVRFEQVPLFTRVAGLPALSPGSSVELGIDAVDLIEAEVRCTFRALKT